MEKGSPSESSGGLFNLIGAKMNWKVTYRSGDGRQSTAFYEADDRTALFAELEKSGMSVVKAETVGSGAVRTPSVCSLVLTWARGHAKALSAIAVIAIGVVAICTFCSQRRAPGEGGARKEAKRIPVTNGLVRVSAETKASPTGKPKGIFTNFVNNVWHDEKGRPHYKVARVIRPGQKTVINGKPWRPEAPVFHHPSEVELDVILSRRPGERIFGDVNWQAFKRDLPNALVDRIEILPDDVPDVVARKQAVMEAKEELVAAIRDGEDPVEILKASREDVNRLADIRDGLLSAVAEMRQDGADEQEIEDAVAAASKVLEEHGIDQPLVSPRTMRERAEAAKARKLQKQKGQ